MVAARVSAIIGLLLGGMITSATDALADRGGGAVPGSRVRVTLTPADPADPQAHDRTLTGTLIGFDGTDLSLRADAGGGTFALSRDRLSRLEVSRGTHGQSAKWGGVGLTVGLFAGLVMGAGAGADQAIGSSGQWMLAGGVAFGLLGALVGAGLGAASTAERWEPVEMEPQAARGVSARPGSSARLALGMRF